MTFELPQNLNALLNPSVTSSIAYEQIDNFHKFILDNVPYGRVDPNYIQQGLIEFDGPAQDPPTGKKPLQWHFGGVPYPIIKAMRIQYSYTKSYQGTDYDLAGSLFIGYEDVSSQLIRMVREDVGGARANDRADRLREFQASIFEARDRLYPPLDDQLTLRELIDIIRIQTLNQPASVSRLAQIAQNLDTFIADNYPYRSFVDFDWDLVLGRNGGSTLPDPLLVEYDGPAQKYDSLQAFPFSLATLFSDQARYNQLLWWYFGGRAYRITKAMRVHYELTAGVGECLWVGFQGPGDFP